ncbi:MAG TPA: tetratricopeptide repeat protein [Thermoanaerobaculia bacterium]|jgi:tetratricopeptide (TPR) repeat protein|nr:tetratricopeptide repeat protein [Thermoanaerobaculia bacterium]
MNILRRTPVLLVLLLAAARLAAATSYEDAMKAVAAGNNAAALPLFEASLAADPDDLKSANEYRKAVIRTKEYDRAIGFFDKLTAQHPKAAYAWLNYGYTYVDKIPDAGSVTQVILANKALTNFSKSIELKKTWIALFTRGNSYLYWPKVFGRAPLGVADLEQAIALSRQEPKQRSVFVRAWIALGDAYWKTEQAEKAKATWRQALQLFPENPEIKARLARDGDELEKYIYDQLDPNKRVDTNLAPLWEKE